VPRTLDEDMAFEVYIAAVDGVGTLADALERLGLSSREDALRDARRVRGAVLAGARRAVVEGTGGRDRLLEVLRELDGGESGR
jgi:soluble P-type ATPase